MTNQNDPIAEIKKAEEEAKNKIEKASRDFDEQLRKEEEKLAEKTAEFENDLREKGNVKIEAVKKEAAEILKSKMATTEAEKNQLRKQATDKQSSAAKEIVRIFEECINA